MTAPLVLVAGNPNAGKTTLFNAVTGAFAKVGNYPGITVDRVEKAIDIEGQPARFVDLPGTYSLAPRSPDEMVAVDVLLGRRNDLPACDAVICIVDASNLERNLYLVSQVLELGRPTVLALNMIDLARGRGISIDTAALSERLGLPVVAIQANQRVGIRELQSALLKALDRPVPTPASPFPAE